MSEFDPVVDLDICDLDADGRGIARLVDGEEIVVPFALPGERVRARLWRPPGARDVVGHADLVEILRASGDRVAPVCDLFGRCGGCQLQHLRYDHQLAFKTDRIRRLWLKHGHDDRVEPCVPSPRTYGYRSKITPHYAKPRRGQPLAIGFKSATSMKVIDVARCALATDAINARYGELREEVRHAVGERRRGATLLVREAASGVTTQPDARIVEQVGELRLEFFAREFFQNNPSLVPALVSFVVDAAADGTARHLVDAYCGSGLFALAAARRFADVVGVEVSSAAVVAATENAKRNGLDNVRFISADASRLFDALSVPAGRTAVVVDPPRAGCGPAFIQQLLRFRPRTVTYVSCNPETQRDDLIPLLDSGYELRRIRPFDMFPQTKHVEAVAVLVMR